MLIKPFPHQTEAIDQALLYLNSREEGNGLIAMPTGTGKSIVIAGLIEKARALYGDVRVEILTHVEELVEQNHAKMCALSPLTPSGIYCAGLRRRDTGTPVTFGSIGSLHRRPETLGYANLVIVDEAHLINPKQSGMYRNYITAKRERNPDLRVIGLSATIFRMGLGLLTEGDLFSDVIFNSTEYVAFNRLIDQGFLCPLITLPTSAQFDLSGVSVMNTGEYNQGALEQAMMGDASATYRALHELVTCGEEQGRKSWLVFASGADHAKQITELLETKFGIDAPTVTADTPKEERRSIVRDFRAGKLRCVVNNNVLTTGFDAPAVDLIAVLRATKSASLWVQMLGRGTRPVWAPGFDIHDDGQRQEAIIAGEKKNCLVLDYTRNTEKLGPINDPVIPRKKKDGEPRAAPIRACPGCGAYNHTLARRCVQCDLELVVIAPDLKLTDRSKFEVLKRAAEVQTEMFDVDRVTYSKGQREGKPPYMLVEYYCGWRTFKEFVLLEHGGNARNLARKWWRERMHALHGDDVALPPAPSSVDEVLPHAHLFPIPTQIRVWYNKKPYPEVLWHDFGSRKDVGGVVGSAELTIA